MNEFDHHEMLRIYFIEYKRLCSQTGTLKMLLINSK